MRLLCCVVAGCLLMGACGGGSEDAGSSDPEVVAAFYPLAFVAQRVAGDRAEIVNLTPPSLEPHDLELTPKQVATLAEADVVLYIGEDFQPAVEEALAEANGEAIDVLERMAPPGDRLEGDPHVWLDPRRMIALAELSARILADVDPAGADAYTEATTDLVSELETLDETFIEGLSDCDRREIVVSHEAYGYLAGRYELEQIGISGVDPESEPSPQHLAEIAQFARDHGVTTIFFESLVSPDVAEALADEVGITTAFLDPLEGRPEEGDYLSAMSDNLDTVRRALDCS